MAHRTGPRRRPPGVPAVRRLVLQDRGPPGHRLRNDRADRGGRRLPPRVLPPGPSRVRLPQPPRPEQRQPRGGRNPDPPPDPRAFSRGDDPPRPPRSRGAARPPYPPAPRPPSGGTPGP